MDLLDLFLLGILQSMIILHTLEARQLQQHGNNLLFQACNLTILRDELGLQLNILGCHLFLEGLDDELVADETVDCVLILLA